MTSSPLHLFSLNCESQKHIDRIQTYLQQHPFDVICLQEIFRVHVDELKDQLGLHAEFAPMSSITQPNRHNMDPLGEWGVALFSRFPLENVETQYYFKNPAGVLTQMDDDFPNTLSRVLLKANISVENTPFTVCTTHFTWTADGQPNDDQLRDVIELERILDGIGEFVVCGDFNIPRGESALYERLLQRVTDYIPAEIESTLDPELHRLKDVKTVIDYIFATQSYKVEQVEVVCGLSDHCAVKGTVYANVR